ncbi:P-type ATPase [Parasponia andersonii]|uniref:Calcium-transporting ATPase n=1 Tax=Parasponia andersonii TaxID=3476 RepID=A0A2P5BR55_PARAD|nr:P-type ATPase [Parasponia andersonii]
MSTIARQRWRVWYRAIYASRAMGSLIASKTKSNNHSQLDTSPLRSSTTATFEVYSPNISHPGSGSHESPSPNTLAPTVVDPQTLVSVVKNKDVVALGQLGGVEGVAASLGIDSLAGIPDNDQDIKTRRERFGSNAHPKKTPKGFLCFVVDALNDSCLLILLALAGVELGLEIKEHGVRKGWYDGCGIFIAVLLVVFCTALRDFGLEIQLLEGSEIRKDIQIEVIRGGRPKQISICDVVVGDIVLLKIGDQVPADGLFLHGFSLQVDESSLTGESDHIRIDSTEHPFLFSGSNVADGFGMMLVTAVGINTEWGSLMCPSSCGFVDRTPLQNGLDKLASSVAKVSSIAALLFLLVMLIRYFTGSTKDEKGNVEFNGSKTDIQDVLIRVVQIVAVVVCTLVVAVPKRLPLAVRLTLAYFMKRMMADHALMRNLSACETMGSVTTICTDKTGTLTLNQMKVIQFWLGQEHIKSKPCINVIGRNVCELFRQGVGLNTTGNIYEPVSVSELELTGSPTEKAILSWGIEDLGMDLEKMKTDFEVLHIEAFNSEKKRSGVLVRKNADSTIHVHWKGAAEMVLEMCSRYHERDGTIEFLHEGARSEIKKIIEGMAASSLRCIAFAYRQISEEEMEYNDDNKAQPRLKESGLTLLGVVGLKDPCRPGLRDAVQHCKSAGVTITMITGDNIFRAKAIAAECGILGPQDQQIDGVVIDAGDFRNCTDDQRMKKIESIRVMARSSQYDKLLMVRCLKQNGHVVAATGDGINDTCVLREANAGLSMGIKGTEVAKQCSDIVILDDNFTSIVKAVRWGRCVYNNIQKFVQFQLTVNVSALAINFIAAVSLGEVPFTAVQLLWVNLIMDVFGAMAFASERPIDELMYSPPLPVQTAQLITSIMWRNILAQSVFQIAVLLFLQVNGESIFHVSKVVNSTMVFNTFVFCQVFNMFNSRYMEKQNVFVGIHKNQLLMGIVGITIVLQVVMVEFLNKLANTTSLSGLQWLACIGIAVLTLPIGWFVKSIPVSDKCLGKLKEAVITSIMGVIVSAIAYALFNAHKNHH